MALNDDEDPYGADGILVLQGEQGIGKTLLCSRLAIHADWFAEGVSIDMGNKDSIIQSTGVWIAELGELDSTLKILFLRHVSALIIIVWRMMKDSSLKNKKTPSIRLG